MDARKRGFARLLNNRIDPSNLPPEYSGGISLDKEVTSMASARGYYKEEMKRSIDNIEMALTHLARVIEAYRKAHPEISEKIKECGDGLVMIAEIIRSIEETV